MPIEDRFKAGRNIVQGHINEGESLFKNNFVVFALRFRSDLVVTIEQNREFCRNIFVILQSGVDDSP